MKTANNSGNPQEAPVDSFFDELDNDVNGIIIDNDQAKESTLSRATGPQYEATPQQSDTHNVDWEKRYKDSSREAVRMRDELNNMKPFVPILDAMKKDTNLVDHVRGYFNEGGTAAKSVKEELGLDEDFIYDAQEAVDKPDSDSGKVFANYVDKAVQSKMGKVLKKESDKNQVAARNQIAKQRMMEFAKRKGLSKDQFMDFMNTLKTQKPTLDDLYELTYRDKSNARIAQNTRNDMMEQMQNVRDIPTSASGFNSPRAEASMDDQVFDDVAGTGLDMNDLFG